MFRARLSHALVLVLALAACSKDKDKTPVPSPEPPAKSETTAKLEPTAAPPAPTAEVTAPPTAEALASAKPNAPAPEPPKDATKTTTAAAGAGEIALPKPKNGVLSKAAADKVIAVGASPIIKLLDAGAEPRADLSYVLTKGATQKIQMAMDVVMALQMGKKAMPAATIPQMTMLLDVGTGDKNPSGEWKIDAKLTQIGINAKGAQQEQIATAMRPQLQAMKGLGMNYWLSGKGRVRDFKLAIPPTFPENAQQLLQGMNQSFESMVAPLPAEPVGIGAKWQVVSRVASAGADLLQSSTYTLKSRTGSKTSLEVALVQYSAGDTINPPGMPAGVSARVKSFNSGGSGTSQVDTSTVTPEAGALSLKTSMTITVDGAGAPGEETSVDTTTKVAISRP